MINYTNIASECGVNIQTAKEYFQILEDTLIGVFIPAFQKKPKRRVITGPKFFYFDVGIANYLLKRGQIMPGSENYGKAFEHFILHELRCHKQYSALNYEISHWRTTSGLEIDFVLGDHEIAIEVKATNHILPKHLKGLQRFGDEYKTKKSILISNDPQPQKINDIDALPWNIFLELLWEGKILRT